MGLQTKESKTDMSVIEKHFYFFFILTKDASCSLQNIHFKNVHHSWTSYECLDLEQKLWGSC